MRLRRFIDSQLAPSLGWSIVIYAAAVGLMGYLRLVVFGEYVIALTYGLPLLLCLYYRSIPLLWLIAVSYTAMSAWKNFFVLPPPGPTDLGRVAQWGMQVINVAVIAASVHLVLRLTERLRRQNRELQLANDNLRAHEEEIAQQNEELQTQAEELSQQNEEIQQQSEELQIQTEELQTVNADLDRREIMLQQLLGTLRTQANERELGEAVCRSALELVGEEGLTALITERAGDTVIVQASCGAVDLAGQAWKFKGSLEDIVLEQSRTAYVDDFAARPDLTVARNAPRAFRSALATPLHSNGGSIGTVEILSFEPRHWTTDQFRILEWVAAQCSLLLDVHRLQLKLRLSKDRLEEAVKARTAELLALVGDLEHFSYTITHDMRAPLRAMQGFAAILQDEIASSLAPEHRDYLERINTAACRMDRLITDALSYSRAVRQEMTLTVVEPGPLIEGMIRSYPVFQPPYAEIRVAPDLPAVIANEAGLTQCFSNLLSNAVKFVHPGQKAEVTVRAEHDDHCVRIWIEDNGIGIPEEMKARIFGMFQRVSKDYEGTGIGLALVKKVAERMGGRVGVESIEGQGARFWLELKSAGSNEDAVGHAQAANAG